MPTTPPQILVVDDSEFVLTALELLLEPFGEVTTTTYAHVAARLLRSRVSVDVLITDVDLRAPISGLELCALAQHYQRAAKVVVFSGLIDANTRAFCRAHRISWVSKSERPRALKRLVVEWLSKM